MTDLDNTELYVDFTCSNVECLTSRTFLHTKEQFSVKFQLIYFGDRTTLTV